MTPELGGEEREVLDRIAANIVSGIAPGAFGTIVDALRDMGHSDAAIGHACRERLAIGQKQYGRLNLAADKRDFMAEVLPELLDALVYIACHEVQQEKRATTAAYPAVTVLTALVYCRYCNKTHGVRFGEKECSEGAWEIDGSGIKWADWCALRRSPLPTTTAPADAVGEWDADTEAGER